MYDLALACKTQTMKEKQDKIAIGDRIRESRLKLNLTQSDIARHLNLKPQSVRQWEEGVASPRGERIQDLADLIKVDPYWLLFGTDNSIAIDSDASTVKDLLESPEFQDTIRECISGFVVESVDLGWLSVKKNVELDLFGDIFLRRLRRHDSLKQNKS